MFAGFRLILVYIIHFAETASGPSPSTVGSSRARNLNPSGCDAVFPAFAPTITVVMVAILRKALDKISNYRRKRAFKIREI